MFCECFFEQFLKHIIGLTLNINYLTAYMFDISDFFIKRANYKISKFSKIREGFL